MVKITNLYKRSICGSFVGQLSQILPAKTDNIWFSGGLRSTFPIFSLFYFILFRFIQLKKKKKRYDFQGCSWSRYFLLCSQICFCPSWFLSASDRQSYYHHCSIISYSPLSPHSRPVSRLLPPQATFSLQPSDIFVHHSNVGLGLVNFAAFIWKCAYIWWRVQLFSFDANQFTF